MAYGWTPSQIGKLTAYQAFVYRGGNPIEGDTVKVKSKSEAIAFRSRKRLERELKG